MLKRHIEELEPGVVYVAEFVKSCDIPQEEVIATKFSNLRAAFDSGMELDTEPVQVYTYKGRYDKQTMENWYIGKYKIPWDRSESLKGTEWYIWLPPDNPYYLEVIKRVKPQENAYYTTTQSADNWGF